MRVTTIMAVESVSTVATCDRCHLVINDRGSIRDQGSHAPATIHFVTVSTQLMPPCIIELLNYTKHGIRSMFHIVVFLIFRFSGYVYLTYKT